MFGLGFFEIILILAGILVFIRPQDLPAFLYRVGKVYGQFKNMYTKFLREANILKNQIDEIVEKETNSITEISKSDNLFENNADKAITSEAKPFNKYLKVQSSETIGRKKSFAPSTSKTTPKKKSIKKNSVKSTPMPTKKAKPAKDLKQKVTKTVKVGVKKPAIIKKSLNNKIGKASKK